MKAKAAKAFTAAFGLNRFKCGAGDDIEADAKTIGQLKALGLVTTGRTKRAAAPRKGEQDD